ncbi:hypothetical protein [Mucilaginibacter lappiensis]|uniref:hypothetical protein n=1 Tax=Mucilaginibacter lappiensis TaxID=354630 RepID=UPI003D210B9E
MFGSRKEKILRKLRRNGYNEQNGPDELFIMDVLRNTADLGEFIEISRVLGKSGGLFCVPTLMAFSVEKDSPKAIPAFLAIAEIYNRVDKTELTELTDFFSPGWWRPRWKGSHSKFISYVACITELANNESIGHPDNFDSIGEKVLKEIDFNIFPFESFHELRLCTSGWDAKGDVKRILGEIAADTLIQSVHDQNIPSSSDTLFEENMLNMRCDYLLTRLNLGTPYEPLRYLLKSAEVLNTANI